MPVMYGKRQRGRVLKTLFALVLGVITWWFVDSLTSLKPDYTLSFPNHGELATDRNAYLQTWSFNLKALDTHDNYLVIERPNVPDDHFIATEVRDLRTGRLLVAHHEDFTERLESLVDYPLSQTRQLANEQGALFQVGEYQSRDVFKRDSVCEWNLLTNKKRIIKTPLPGTRYLLNRDGSKLITITCLSPSISSVIGPPGWANCFPLLADPNNDFHKLGPVLVRVYSLPALTLNNSFSLPSPCGLSITCAIPDGSGLLIGCSEMNPSNLFDTLDFSAIQALHPKGLAVYDLTNGQLRHRIADHPGVSSAFFSWDDWGRNLAEITLKNDPYQKQSAPKINVNDEDDNGEKIDELIHRLRDYSVAYYHLPSNRWIDVDGDRATSVVSSNRHDRILSKDKSSDNWRVWEVGPDGKTTQLNWVTCQLGDQPKLIHNSDQLIFIRESHLRLPQWLRTAGEKFRSIQSWIERSSFRLVFYDYLQNRELGFYKLGTNKPSTPIISPQGNSLILESHDEVEHTVAVFSLPVNAWSPWWARCAALLVSLFLLFLSLRGRAS